MCIVKKTKCSICGQDAMPIYLRGKIAEEENKGMQFFRAGTWCLNPECDAIYTDNGLYRNVSNTPENVEKCRITRENHEKEEIKSVLIKMFKDPETRKKLGIVPLIKKK